MDIRRVVGENVRRIRVSAGLSQEELAARIGVEQGYVSRLEAGKRASPRGWPELVTAAALQEKDRGTVA